MKNLLLILTGVLVDAKAYILYLWLANWHGLYTFQGMLGWAAAMISRLHPVYFLSKK
ncbi:hypothetical protein [Heyndrickxia acidiproducens]|uniref:hypothetical protein n=1 Tax=Heyndrickxia acidiproducens TaxID=1121084 RepID=UPI00036323FF|nr:hypothetical protein [Heyndrickxia acidiproducens]